MFRSMARKAICAGLAAVSLCTAVGCAKQERVRCSKTYLEFFDTVTQIVGYETDEEVFSQNCEAVYSLLEEYHQLTDIYHSYEGVNNVRTVNKNAGIAPVKVDEKLIDLLEFSKEMCSSTGGMCNIAMGSVLSIWHKYREQGIDDPESAVLPPMDDLTEASEHCSIDDLIIDREAGTVYLADTEMSLDLGAAAKGYAVERAAELLMSRGVADGYSINIGGNVRTIGKKSDGSDWAAGIQNPDTDSEQPYVVRIKLNDMALVTSGNYQRYYEVDGVRYHHIIDPATLMPLNYFDSVSVLCGDSGMADSLSTALFNMPVDEGKRLLSGMDGVDAVWVFPDGTFDCTEGFEELIIDENFTRRK